MVTTQDVLERFCYLPSIEKTMSIRYTSPELYHFVGFKDPSNHETNYKVLCKILDDKAITHWPHEAHNRRLRFSLNWDADLEKGDLVIPEVTCFCDIPYEALSVHTRKYGQFGVSFSRKFLVKRGARPVTYIPLQSTDRLAGFGTIYSLTMLRDWMRMREGFYEQVVLPIEQRVQTRTLGVKPDNPNDAILAVDDFLTKDVFAFLKVFDSDLTDEVAENFYMEREWRKLGNLRFDFTDIRHLIVNQDYILRLALEYPDLARRIAAAP